MDDLTIVNNMLMIESGIQVAEDLVHAIVGVKRRLSFQSSTTMTAAAAAANGSGAATTTLLHRHHNQSLVVKTQKLSSVNKRRRLVHKPKKSVRFSDVNHMRTIERLDEISTLEENWYQENEYKQIKEEFLKTLVLYMKSNMKMDDIDETKHCIRGLETQINILILRMPYRNRQKKVVKSVLNLQQIQRTMKQNVDSNALREMSLIVSKQDSIMALTNASKDSMIVR
jgi:hypothetical protein